MSTRPNVLVVITDDQGYGDLACHGNPLLRTPHLDAFHAEAVRLTDFHVGPTCAPTRASLLTGHHANSTGVWHTIGGRSLLRDDEWTLAQALGDHGYRTGLFGKWHLGDAPPFLPEQRGFDTVARHGGGGITQTPDHWGNDYFDDTYVVDGVPTAFKGYCTDVWFDLARDFVTRDDPRPFFCWLAPNAPHNPLNVEDRWAAPYRGAAPEDRARFYGMIENLDDNFGALRRALAEHDLERDTVLVFLTDNGTATGVDADAEGFVSGGFNAGMRGKKGSPYEGGHRVPVFLRHPRSGLGGGVDVDPPAHAVDFMPTILSLCGVDPPAERGFHGVDLEPALRGRPMPELADRALVTDSQRLPRPKKWKDSCVIWKRWRLIRGEALYDLDRDPGQRRDVSAEHPRLVERLRGEYERWWTLVSGRFDQPIPFLLPLHAGQSVRLTAHDWRNDDGEVPFHQGMIRQGLRHDGAWEVRVPESGRYRFSLARWPAESGHAVTAGIDGDDVPWRPDAVPPDLHWLYTGGEALGIERASLGVGGQRKEAAVAAGDRAASLELDLPAGVHELHARFSGEKLGVVGAYYVDAERIDP